MGVLLQRAKSQTLAGSKLASPTSLARGLLEGTHLSLFHGRSQEFDDLRPYVQGDDVRDIDWKATARSDTLLVKRFVSMRQHKILLVVDTSRAMAGVAPSGEVKRDVAVNAMGLVGLVALTKGDEVGLVFGDARGSARIPSRRGEAHVEHLLARVSEHDLAHAARDSLAVQLSYVERNFRKRYVVFVISGEPQIDGGSKVPKDDSVDDALAGQLRRVAARHDLYWILIRDAPILDPDAEGGYDVETGRSLLREEVLGRKVLVAYQEAEKRHEAALAAFLAHAGLRAARVSGSAQLHKEVTTLLHRSGHGG